VRSYAAAMTMSVEECLGMTVVVGNHTSVSTTRSALVFQAQGRVWCPCASGIWLFMYEHLGAR
jgi:hypothetical protein